MTRPAKSIAMQSDTTRISKEEATLRKEAEEALRGGCESLKPPKRFSKRRKKIFKSVVSELNERGILGNLDQYVLEKFATAVDMLEQIDERIDNDIDSLDNSKLKSSRDMYSRDFFKCCTELCLSPSSRAKAAVQRAENKKKPTSIFDALGDAFED